MKPGKKQVSHKIIKKPQHNTIMSCKAQAHYMILEIPCPTSCCGNSPWE